MTAATFVHIGDAHMGPNARNADRWRAIDQIVGENIGRDDLAAWLIPGDMNHGRMTIEDRNAWAERLHLMASVAPVIKCYGNHDLPGDLDVFAKLRAVWPIHVAAKPQVLAVQLATGQMASIFILPYPTESGLAAAGVAPGDMVQTARAALDVIFMDAAARLAEARKQGDLTLMIGHVNVAGAITSVGQPNIGHEIELDAALLARLGDCYKGLNHIHKHQDIAGAVYPGSICRLDWGEIEPKGYVLVHYEDVSNALSRRWMHAWRFVPLAVAPMYHVEGWLSRDGFTYDVKAGPEGAVLEKPASWKGCEVRVRARFHQSEKALLELAKAHVLAEFAEAARLELEPIAVPDGALRAPQVAAARTLVEKVEAYAVETKTVLPAAVLEVLPALEHGDPETVVGVERRLMDTLLNPPARAAAEPEKAQAVA